MYIYKYFKLTLRYVCAFLNIILTCKFLHRLDFKISLRILGTGGSDRQTIYFYKFMNYMYLLVCHALINLLVVVI